MKGKGEKKQNSISRISPRLEAELKEIQQTRKDSGTDKATTSINDLTSLIVKHNSWPLMKKEIIEYNFKDE